MWFHQVAGKSQRVAVAGKSPEAGAHCRHGRGIFAGRNETVVVDSNLDKVDSGEGDDSLGDFEAGRDNYCCDKVGAADSREQNFVEGVGKTVGHNKFVVVVDLEAYNNSDKVAGKAEVPDSLDIVPDPGTVNDCCLEMAGNFGYLEAFK